jgi:hypothetical protein
MKLLRDVGFGVAIKVAFSSSSSSSRHLLTQQ